MPPRMTVLWSWVSRPGHEAARVTQVDGSWQLDGSAAFADDGQSVCLDYRVVCDETWTTRSASVTGWVGGTDVDVRITTENGIWFLNGEPQPQLSGCVDVDLNFSPSTNLLPIRRLNLAVGDEATVRAAWLRFPTFRMEVLEQRYRRSAEQVYEYESGSFRARIEVDDFGLAVDYAGVWRREA